MFCVKTHNMGFVSPANKQNANCALAGGSLRAKLYRIRCTDVVLLFVGLSSLVVTLYHILLVGAPR